MGDGAIAVEVLRRAEQRLAASGVESPRAEAEALLGWLEGTGRAGLYGRRGRLSSRVVRAMSWATGRRGAGVPLQRLTGEQWFCGLRLRVASGVFIPRPETEVLVEAALELVAGLEAPTVVDVGTGTGAVGLAVKDRRSDARVMATDVSRRAVALARWNAARLGLEVDVRRGDLLEPVPGELGGRVDLIVSNPPYLTEEEVAAAPREVRVEPRTALVGGTRVHARIVAAADRWLRPGGRLAMEVGASEGEEVAGLLAAFEEVRVVADLAGRDRVVIGRARAAVVGPRGG